MCSSDFKESASACCSLPGKKYEDVLEMLQAIYYHNKPISTENVDVLLEFSREYQMDELKDRCESFLLSDKITLHSLALAEEYGLERLFGVSVQSVSNEQMERLKAIKEYRGLQDSTKLAIMERKLARVGEVKKAMQQRLKVLAEEPYVEGRWQCGTHWVRERPYTCHYCQVPNGLKRYYETANSMSDELEKLIV